MHTAACPDVDVAGRRVLGVSATHPDVAHILDGATKSGGSVLHDLMPPLRRSVGGIDHVVVSSRKVWVAETIRWADHGPRRVVRNEIEELCLQVRARLHNHGIMADVGSLTIVAGEMGSRMSCRHEMVDVRHLPRWLKRNMSDPADPGIVDDLVPLLRTPLQPTGLIAAGLLRR